VNDGGTARLSFSPGRIDPTNPAWNSSRKPLVGEFTYHGRALFVIANHLIAKVGDDPLFGRNQPPNFVTEPQRRVQAQVEHDFVNSIAQIDPTANVVVLGDLNDFQFSRSLSILEGGASPILADLIDALPENARYSYDFEGNSETLDHILTSTPLVAAAVLQPIHVNAEFADKASDHDPMLARISLPSGSFHLDGASGYAEVGSSTELNLTGDWTVETWFKDEDPNGFNHDFRQMVMKGDRNASAEAPYYIVVGNNHLLGGVRTAGTDYPLDVNLAVLGLDPAAWHHVALSFRADLNVLNVWLDGRHIAYTVVPSHSVIGNALPLEIGRNGPATGKYWSGKLDDLRIWNVARSGADISSSFATELIGSQPGLVANWHFDEASGTVAADSAGHHHDAMLIGGASFAADHP